MIVDTNVHLSRWPFRRLPGDETPELVKLLRRHGVTQAWASSFDALLHKDIAAVNARIADECKKNGAGMLVPFGSVNPTLPDWEEDLRRCHEVHRMLGIRLFPNYHGYALDRPEFGSLLRQAARRNLVVQIALKMEDARTQHPLVRVPPVDAAGLPKIAADVPGLRLMILNGQLANAKSIVFDIAMLEGLGCVARLIGQIGPERVLFGSHAPFYAFDAAALKVKESGLDAAQSSAVLSGNALRLLEGK